LEVPKFVTPSRLGVRDDGQAGVQNLLEKLDSGFRLSKIPLLYAGNDAKREILIFYEFIILSFHNAF
jgi:hypothetical protein